MSETVTDIPTDFYDDNGWLKSINTTSHPTVGDDVVIDGKMYIAQKKTFDFDAGGIPLLIRVYLKLR